MTTTKFSGTPHTYILRASELRRLGWVDDVVEEPLGGAHRDPQRAAMLLRDYLDQVLSKLKSASPETFLRKRRERVARRLQACATLSQAITTGREDAGLRFQARNSHHVH